MIKDIILLLSNKYLKAMLFSFLLMVMAIEKLDNIYVKVLIYLIAIAIAISPIIEVPQETKQTGGKTK